MAIIHRYTNTPTYQHEGDTYSIRYKRISKDSPYTTLTITEKNTTFDELSLKYYNTPLLYWLIADFNDYLDPDAVIQQGTVLKIPKI